jgi:hypothetical protein
MCPVAGIIGTLRQRHETDYTMIYNQVRTRRMSDSMSQTSLRVPGGNVLCTRCCSRQINNGDHHSPGSAPRGSTGASRRVHERLTANSTTGSSVLMFALEASDSQAPAGCAARCTVSPNEELSPGSPISRRLAGRNCGHLGSSGQSSWAWVLHKIQEDPICCLAIW